MMSTLSVISRKRERQITLVAVVVPVLGFFVGMVLLWGGAVGPIELILLLGMYGLTLLGVEGGFHRMASHNAFQTVGTVRSLLIIFGSMALQGPVLFWAATHRRHHQYADRPEDPHSPQHPRPGLRGALQGFWHAHMGWLFVHENRDWTRYIPDLLKDNLLFRVNRLYPFWVLCGLFIPAVIGGAYTHTWAGAFSGFLWGGLIRIFLVHHSVWSVNSICHLFGRRPFKTRERSTNNPWLCLTSMGGAWHNNHHAFPNTASNAFRWWQIDPCGYVIRLLEYLGLAWDVHFPTKTVMESRMNCSEEREA
jgi:stearoyl-CoA desaturase (delta-9 desaturase)